MNDDAMQKLKDDAARGIERLHGNVKASLQDAIDTFDKGDFEATMHMLGEVQSKLGLLGFAEAKLASVGNGHIVRTREIQVGMVLQSLGVVEEAEITSERCESGRHTHDFVKLTIEGDDEPHFLPVEGEVVVIPAA